MRLWHAEQDANRPAQSTRLAIVARAVTLEHSIQGRWDLNQDPGDAGWYGRVAPVSSPPPPAIVAEVIKPVDDAPVADTRLLQPADGCKAIAAAQANRYPEQREASSVSRSKVVPLVIFRGECDGDDDRTGRYVSDEDLACIGCGVGLSCGLGDDLGDEMGTGGFAEDDPEFFVDVSVCRYLEQWDQQAAPFGGGDVAERRWGNGAAAGEEQEDDGEDFLRRAKEFASLIDFDDDGTFVDDDWSEESPPPPLPFATTTKGLDLDQCVSSTTRWRGRGH